MNTDTEWYCTETSSSGLSVTVLSVSWVRWNINYVKIFRSCRKINSRRLKATIRHYPFRPIDVKSNHYADRFIKSLKSAEREEKWWMVPFKCTWTGGYAEGPFNLTFRESHFIRQSLWWSWPRRMKYSCIVYLRKSISFIHPPVDKVQWRCRYWSV